MPYSRGDAARTLLVNDISRCPASLRKRGIKKPQTRTKEGERTLPTHTQSAAN